MMRDRFIPGVLALSMPRKDALPLVLDSPHSGAMYPLDFGTVLTRDRLRRAEDMYVDELYIAAPRHGASLLCALFPRSYIDPNRAIDDIDPDLLAEAWPSPPAPSEKSELGVGLIWRFCPPGAEPLYERRLSIAEVQSRIEGFYLPYHTTLQRLLDDVRQRFGGVWHINCHSMPSYCTAAGVSGPQIALGDYDGAACTAEFTAFVRECFTRMGYQVSVNKPYRGAELVRRYGDPAQNRHSLMIEINRGLYMNQDTFEKRPGFAALQTDIARLIAEIAAYIREQIHA